MEIKVKKELHYLLKNRKQLKNCSNNCVHYVDEMVSNQYHLIQSREIAFFSFCFISSATLKRYDIGNLFLNGFDLDVG